MPKFYPEKDTEDKTKDYLLGIYSRLQEVFRGRFGLVHFKEGYCHGGMTIQDIQFAVIFLWVA